MQKSLSQTSDDQIRIIRMAKFWRIFYYAATLFFGLHWIVTTIAISILAAKNLLEKWPKMPNIPAFSVLLLLYFAWIVYVYWRARTVRLVFSSAGLEYYDVGLNIFTTWDNIERIGKVGLGKLWDIGPNCIVMRKAPEFRSSKWGAIFYFGRGWNIALYEFGIHQLNKSEQELKEYVPRLFE